MIIEPSTVIAYATAQVLPALWHFITGRFQTQTQVIERYCPPSVELPANMTDFQKAQYEKQCGNLNVYTIKATPVKKAKPELIGPPQPVEVKP